MAKKELYNASKNLDQRLKWLSLQKRKGKKMINTKARSRRKFTLEFKTKVAMEALQEK